MNSRRRVSHRPGPAERAARLLLVLPLVLCTAGAFIVSVPLWLINKGFGQIKPGKKR